MTNLERRAVLAGAGTLAINAVTGGSGAQPLPSPAPGNATGGAPAREEGYIGRPVSRLDGPQKVKGAARFAAEVRLPGMVYAALAFSTVAKGRIAALDTAEAEAAPGVVLVMTHRNAPRMAPAPVFLTAPKAAAGDDLPVMQDDRVYWNGQPIAVILAETQEEADHARSLIRVAYESEPAMTVFGQAKTRTREVLYAGQRRNAEVGDAEVALAAAPHRLDVTYRTPRHNHNAIEPHAVTVAWDGDDLLIHDCAQGVGHVAWSLAQVLGIDERRIRVVAPYVGGGFGGKTMWQHHILAAAASRLAGRPVRLALSREGVYRVVGGRANTEQRVAIGALADGRLDALIHTGVASMTRHNSLPESFTNPTRVLYGARTLKVDVRVADMDMLANTFMRAPGESVGSFALESALDELAEQLGMDPIELRIRNEPERDPIHHTPFSSRHLVDAYRAGAERFGWAARDARPAMRRRGEWLLGMGVATATYPYNRFPGGAARITLTRDGRARVEIAAHEMGMGTATAHTQVAADRLGLPMDRVTFAYGDTALPGTVLAGGSQQTASIGASFIAAERALVAELLRLAGDRSPLAGLTPDGVGIERGALYRLDRPNRRESFAAILGRARREEVSVEASAPPPAERQRWSMHSYGAIFCEVRVNAVTGEPRIERLLGSFHCGRILNPKMARSQFRGGMIMGLGLALVEDTHFDERNGRVVNASLAEYHVPAHMDVPEIDVLWTDIPDPQAPLGALGVGEIGITGVGAAVANAVYNATGRRVRELPITLDKLM
jgi:xanthine dehydrogenase YagR molybdenum-binding subunit